MVCGHKRIIKRNLHFAGGAPNRGPPFVVAEHTRGVGSPTTNGRLASCDFFTNRTIFLNASASGRVSDLIGFAGGTGLSFRRRPTSNRRPTSLRRTRSRTNFFTDRTIFLNASSGGWIPNLIGFTRGTGPKFRRGSSNRGPTSLRRRTRSGSDLFTDGSVALNASASGWIPNLIGFTRGTRSFCTRYFIIKVENRKIYLIRRKKDRQMV